MSKHNQNPTALYKWSQHRASIDEEKENGAIQAKFAGVCFQCGGTIYVGDRIEVGNFLPSNTILVDVGNIELPQVAMHERCNPLRKEHSK